ncbi:SDR family NAD(P)-dependent oxidoreductase [Streptomyces sp. NBC_00038]|uniref:SDR family NAD(P)-dependent oxidoreductase n=1 Tax=Streptomyces sp. NBC_00038 TaxID=2903615 RepID=UPI00225980A0|nr:SDR family oxidoreductase [Streptomyces sp. NBC_00038]MCX5554506.1 SDR family oxidoreductase [Streptomyces sp. NBC_00038]
MYEVRNGGLDALRLEGKVAVVTGGSSGIGAATANRLAEQGALVVVGFHHGADRAAQVVAHLPGTGHRHLAMSIEDSPQLSEAAQFVENHYGRCDVLVNSAGMTRKVAHSDLGALDDELFDSLMRVNVRGPFAVVRAFASLMQSTGDAIVVNVSSISGSTALGSNIAYCAAKAALDNLTMSLGRVLGPEIRVIGVAPAAVDTGFVPGRGRSAMLAQAAATPLQVVVAPDDIAIAIIGAVTHFRVATGTTFLVDGGKHL